MSTAADTSMRAPIAPVSAGDSFRDFSRVVDAAVYRPVPDDWWVGATDVVDSTAAIEAGRYKAVNMAGAAAIGAVSNALQHGDFPFAFGGDGASLAVAPEHEGQTREALARTVRWVSDELGLQLRAAMMPVSEVRAAGYDVRVAYYAPSDAVRYAMFAGGGMEWAEGQLKSGRHAIAPAAADARPDLTGLSCRWKPLDNERGVMLSVIARRAPGVDDGRFLAAVSDVLAELGGTERGGHPVPSDGPELGSPLAGFDLEARTGQHGRATWPVRLKLLVWRVFAWVIFRSGVGVGGFEAGHYRSQTALNSDFRKFHDGLHMTVDCTGEEAERIEALLAAQEEAGTIRYGVFRQSNALMTCIVPSALADDHYHFIDGGGGGYAEAARFLKSREARGAGPG